MDAQVVRRYRDELTPSRSNTISGSVGKTLVEILAEFDAFIANCGVSNHVFISYEFTGVSYKINTNSKDYTIFHRAALAFADIMTDVIEDGGLVAQSTEAQSLEQLFNIVWEIDKFMGGILSKGGTVQGESNVPADQRPQSRSRMIDGLILQVDFNNEIDEPKTSFTQCYMRAWGRVPISKERHLSRNDNQRHPTPPQSLSNLPRDYFVSAGETATHNIGTSGNQDFRGILHPYFRWQLIYDTNGTLVTDAINLGTYDYASPIFLFAKHIQVDITPWVEWGNSDADRSTRAQRLEALYQTGVGILSQVSYFKNLYNCVYASENLD